MRPDFPFGLQMTKKLITAIQLFLFSCSAFAAAGAASDPATQWGGKWAGAIFMLVLMVLVFGAFIWAMFYKKAEEAKK